MRCTDCGIAGQMFGSLRRRRSGTPGRFLPVFFALLSAILPAVAADFPDAGNQPFFVLPPEIPVSHVFSNNQPAGPAAEPTTHVKLRVVIPSAAPGPGRPEEVQAMAPPLARAVPTARYTPPPDIVSRRWLQFPVRFELRQQPLARVLEEFCSRQNVACDVLEPLSGFVTGRFHFSDPGEFLDLLAQAQRFNWYFDGAKAHFFPESAVGSKFFPLEGRREETLRKALIDLGLFDPRFSWKVADDGQVLMVQGPKMYLDLVGEMLERQQTNAAAVEPERELGVFRLKHAWATDQTVNIADGSTVAPGVASLLRQILSETPFQAPASPPTPAGEPAYNRGKGSGLVARRREDQAAAPEDAAVPFVQADARLNAVLVWDFKENMPRYQAIIDNLDQPLTLVEIRAAIVDVEADRSRELGVAWELRSEHGGYQGNLGSNVGEDANIFKQISGDGLQYSTIYTRGLDQFMARVSAMEKDGGANVLSRPSVLTQDNIQATLEHTETFYVKLTGEREVDLADVTTGLILRVTPHVVAQGGEGPDKVQLAVHIVNGTGTVDSDAAVDNLPRVKQSTISTQAVVHEGEALVIGGYYNETRQSGKTGVPLLKNIPVMGALFRKNTSINTKSERLFVLSPRIIRAGENYIQTGTEAERAFDVSPGRERLDGPAFDDSTPKQPKRLFWNNPQPDGSNDYSW